MRLTPRHLAAGALTLACLGGGVSTAEDTAPLAPELLEARKIFVRQTMIDPKIVSRFRSEMAKWERLEVVVSEKEADIVATLSADIEHTETVADTAAAETEEPPGSAGPTGDRGPRPMGTVRVLEDIHLRITDADGTELWHDAVPAGSLSGNSSRRLAKRFRKRIEDEEA